MYLDQFWSEPLLCGLKSFGLGTPSCESPSFVFLDGLSLSSRSWEGIFASTNEDSSWVVGCFWR
jgi:hypothetical protein